MQQLLFSKGSARDREILLTHSHTAFHLSRSFSFYPRQGESRANNCAVKKGPSAMSPAECSIIIKSLSTERSAESYAHSRMTALTNYHPLSCSLSHSEGASPSHSPAERGDCRLGVLFTPHHRARKSTTAVRVYSGGACAHFYVSLFYLFASYCMRLR
jgi:hypothetical protein